MVRRSPPCLWMKETGLKSTSTKKGRSETTSLLLAFRGGGGRGNFPYGPQDPSTLVETGLTEFIIKTKLMLEVYVDVVLKFGVKPLVNLVRGAESGWGEPIIRGEQQTGSQGELTEKHPPYKQIPSCGKRLQL